MSWKENSIEANASPSDRVSVLLNQPEMEKYIWLQEVGKRNDLTIHIPLTPENQELQWEVYLLFHRPMNSKKTMISDLQYSGRR
ncbi:hypothetical protein [Algoriphagus aquimarinus]|uniref:hypothetical protein n=1 Tax=Algoriphagus aquimarinus TaxID=237018 RepID=UPI0030DD1198|tara:strand:- start:17751 stop:18002 length:252 start_codon:yes stop_codon:yes gene_type:complete